MPTDQKEYGELDNWSVDFWTITYDELSQEAQEMYDAAINAPLSSFVKTR